MLLTQKGPPDPEPEGPILAQKSVLPPLLAALIAVTRSSPRAQFAPRRHGETLHHDPHLAPLRAPLFILLRFLLLRHSSSVGSTSSSTAAAASKLPAAASNAKVVAKCMVYDDDYFTLPSAPAPHPNTVPEDGLSTREDDLAPLHELPDPDDVSADTSSTSVVSAAADDDALAASADSCVTEVPARADSATDTEAPAAAVALPEDVSLALAELRDASGLSPRSKRLLTALAEATALELAAPATATTTATARRLRLRRAGFWGKVRVAVLAATLAAVAMADVALAAYLLARHANEWYGHALLPPSPT